MTTDTRHQAIVEARLIDGTGVAPVEELLVEQNVHLALGVATYGYVLQVGRTVIEGDTATLRASAVVKKAYLGERADRGVSGRA